MSGTEILLLILGGVALLLWGCRMVRTGMMRAFGDDLMRLLGAVAGNRWQAAAAGAIVGTLLQSSTATALLVSPFVAQGAILTSLALAIMLGADLGSAIAALIFSSGISVSWPVFAFVGYVVHVGSGERRPKVKHVGRIMIGLGLLFLGLRTIGDAASSLSSSHVILELVKAAADEPLLVFLAGTLLTWISYSSIAVVLFAVALSVGAGIAPEDLLPLILGVNFGAALPALSSTLSELPATRRIPIGNLIFRTTAVFIVFVLLDPVTQLIFALVEGDGARIIFFHVAFNAALIPFFVGFLDPVATLLQRMLPDAAIQGARTGPRFLNQNLFETPSAALGAASRETLRMGEIVEDMLGKTIEALAERNRALEGAVEAEETELDSINDAIKLYMTRLMRHELDERDARRAIEIVAYTTNLEQVGDIIERNLMDLATKKSRLKVTFSEAGIADIRRMHEWVMDTLHLSLNVFTSRDVESARMLLNRKVELRALEIEGNERHLARLLSGKFESMATSSIHLDVIRDFRRIHSHLVSVAYPVLEQATDPRR
jgi:phosphate:Na+ symporter